MQCCTFTLITYNAKIFKYLCKKKHVLDNMANDCVHMITLHLTSMAEVAGEMHSPCMSVQ